MRLFLRSKVYVNGLHSAVTEGEAARVGGREGGREGRGCKLCPVRLCRGAARAGRAVWRGGGVQRQTGQRDEGTVSGAAAGLLPESPAHAPASRPPPPPAAALRLSPSAAPSARRRCWRTTPASPSRSMTSRCVCASVWTCRKVNSACI